MSDNTDGSFVIAPSNMKYDDKVIKKMVGEILAQTDGVLGTKGGLGDVFKKKDTDPTVGISVNITEAKDIVVGMKLIVEKGKNIPNIVNEITAKVTDLLQNTAGLNVKDVNIEVVDVEEREAPENPQQ